MIPELLLLFSLVLRHSPDRAELCFGGGRLPSAGQLVDSQPTKKKWKENGKEERGKRGPTFAWKSCYLPNEQLGDHKTNKNNVAFDIQQSQSYTHTGTDGQTTTTKKKTLDHIWEPFMTLFIKKNQKHATVWEWRQAVRNRVAQAGRRHQHSTDNDENRSE